MTIWAISGCSSGLGLCWTTSIIEDRGDTVIGITRSADAARELVNEFGERFVPVICDVTDEDALSRKLIEATERTGEPSRIVTAAGYAQFGTLEDLSNEAINAQFRTNVEGTLNVVRPLLPQLRKTHDPRILIVSSMSGIVSWPLLGAYQISKYAVEAVADTLRRELHEAGIMVGCIEPGPHKTGWASTYAKRCEIGAAYNAESLKRQASCGYPIQDAVASLPYFWAMFDGASMPRRIATSSNFVDLAIADAHSRINDWKLSHAG